MLCLGALPGRVKVAQAHAKNQDECPTGNP